MNIMCLVRVRAQSVTYGSSYYHPNFTNKENTTWREKLSQRENGIVRMHRIKYDFRKHSSERLLKHG